MKIINAKRKCSVQVEKMCKCEKSIKYETRVINDVYKTI